MRRETPKLSQVERVALWRWLRRNGIIPADADDTVVRRVIVDATSHKPITFYVETTADAQRWTVEVQA